MTIVGNSMYAMGDSGSDFRVAVLDRSCALQRWLTVPVEPYDVEDLAAADGSLWLADTGDNRRSRDTVALTRMDPNAGAGELHRLTYPDGAHDAETLLIEPGGRPVIVTKEMFGPSGIYTPAEAQTVGALPSPGPSPLVKRGVFRAATTGDTGPSLSTLVTGGAVSADGRAAAIRTYTDVYLYPVHDGDVVAALTSAQPTVVPIRQPQGESIAFTPDGDLLAGSEAGSAPGAQPSPLQILRGAVASVAPVENETVDTDRQRWFGVVVIVVIGAAVLLGRRAGRTRGLRFRR